MLVGKKGDNLIVADWYLDGGKSAGTREITPAQNFRTGSVPAIVVKPKKS